MNPFNQRSSWPSAFLTGLIGWTYPPYSGHMHFAWWTFLFENGFDS